MAKKRKTMHASREDNRDANFEPGDLNSEESENRRGRTVVAEVGKAIQKGIKIPLKWNRNNVPTGVNRITFANYIGVVVHERVNINFRDWDDVLEKVKDEVYEHITKGFIVPEDRKSYVLGRASIRWRTFKARLRRNWMYDFKSENNIVIVRTPPTIYPWILQSDWDKFIVTCTDPKFKVISDLNRERAKKRTSTYRGGRKGYLYYEEEIVKEWMSKKLPIGEVPRHIVWLRAHSKEENGVMYFDNPADLELALAIGNNGIETMTDHLSDYVEKDHVETIYHVSPVKEKTYVPIFAPVNDHVIDDQLFPKGVESMCSLAIEKDDWVDVVAHGSVYVPKEGEMVKHHFKPVPSDHYRVSITEKINSNAPLPCPEEELRYVCQGKNSYFIWPVHLVIPRNEANKKPTNEVTPPSPHSLSSQASTTGRYTITAADKLKLTSNLIKVFKDVAIGMKKNAETKYFTVPATVFQNEQTVSLDF